MPARPIEFDRLHARARGRGVNPLVYWLVRALMQPFFHLYFRLSRIGREHIPADGPLIFAANHRSFLDPFVIGTLVRRPIYYVAKQELFRHRLAGWFLNSLGAFPVQRGQGDGEMIETCKAILARGDCVVIFPEGTRTRPGSLGRPRRGVGRLALETGAPVIPVAVIGTEAIRRGWRIRPHKVRIRVGRPVTFPCVPEASPQLAAAVSDRIWPSVMLQWEWLGGLPPIRRAAVVGAGAWGRAVATMLASAGVEVQLGCTRPGQAEAASTDPLRPAGVHPVAVGELELSRHDLVCFAVGSRALPAAVAAHAQGIAPRAGVLVASRGLVAPLGVLPLDYVAARVGARAVACLAGPARPADVLAGRASLTVACADRGLGRQLGDLLSVGGYDARSIDDAVGAGWASCASAAAALAAGTAASAGPGAAGAAAGKVFAEVDALARSRGARAETFAGLAGAGALVAGVVDDGPAEGGASVPLLAGALREAGLPASAVDGLARVVQGQLEPAGYAASLTAPEPGHGARRAA